MSSIGQLLVIAPLLLTQISVLAQSSAFQTFRPEFSAILGAAPRLTLLYESPSIPLFHEAAIYYPPTKSLFVSSNQFNTTTPSPATANKQIIITRVSGLDAPANVKVETINAPGIPLPNGGIRWIPSTDNSTDQLLWCAQGNLLNDPPNGIVAMLAVPPYTTTNLLSTYYGKPFNSPNDVVVAKDGAIYFTDPVYGSFQGVRPAPKLRNQVYRFDPYTNVTRVVADGFTRPNGVAFNTDQSILYITDTGSIIGDGTLDLQGPATVYAYNVRPDGNLANSRVFAYTTNGVPDGVKIDTNGNLYTGEGDGIAVYNPKGDLIGKILVTGGCSNFAIGEPGVLFLLNEKKLYRADISVTVHT